MLKKNVKKTYNQSIFKSIIFDIRSILPKKGCKKKKKIKKGLEYVEEMKELTFLQIENGKNNLIKLKNDLIERFKKNDRRKTEAIMIMKKIRFMDQKMQETYLIKMMMIIIMKGLNVYFMKVMLMN